MRIGRSDVDGHRRTGEVRDGRIHPLPGDPSVLEALTTEPSTVGTGTDFRPAVPVDWEPSLRDCVGFLDHVRNARAARGVTDPLPRAWSERPAFYFANPASLHASEDPVAMPPECVKFDFELEIGAVLTSAGSDLTAEQAADRIGGYVLYCDWSARDIQTEERAMQIGQGKGKDAAISLGPWILSAADAAPFRVEDGFDVEVSVHVNGRQVVRTPFTGMDWTFEELVAYSSVGSTVRAGDIIASGTVPGGCLMELAGTPGFSGWLQPGDHVVLDAGPLGSISADITAPSAPPRWRRDGDLHSPSESESR